VERQRAAGVVTGGRRPGHWTEAGRAPDLDVWDVKHMFEEVLAAAGQRRTVEPGDEGWVVRDDHGVVFGWAHPLTADAPPWAAPLFGFEMDLPEVEDTAVRFRELPATPASERDVALVLPPGVVAADVEAAMKRAAGPLLEAVQVFDEYRGAGLPGRSVAWRLVFRDPARTLRDADVDAAVKRVLEALRSEFGIQRR
jgi:phenylalanyl-tRNA synthetase beta chain